MSLAVTLASTSKSRRALLAAFVFLGNHKAFPVSVKVGRQELFYGDHRLVGRGGCGGDLVDVDAAGLRVEQHQVGEGAADVDADHAAHAPAPCRA